MKRSLTALIFGLVMSVTGPAVLAQTVDPIGVPPYGPTHVGSANINDNHSFRPPAPREPKVITKGRLALSESDRAAFATLLAEKDSGLIRLLPVEAFQNEMGHAGRRRFFLEGGPFFSFASRTHAFGFSSDIGFSQDKISVGIGGVNYGMITNLGDTSLEAINLSDPRLKSLAAFVPPKSQTVAQEAYTRITSGAGMSLDGHVYRNQLPADANATYLLRSIVDRQSDVLVAFRLVRKDNDGSAVIAWKLLKQYPTPKLKRTSPRFQ